MARSRLRKILDNIASWRFERRMRKVSPRYAELVKARDEARRRHKPVRHIQKEMQDELHSHLSKDANSTW